MKKVVLFLVLILLLSMNVFAVGGFDGLEWGMSEEKVNEILSGYENYTFLEEGYTTETEEKYYEYEGRSQFPVNGKYAVFFYFPDGKLRSFTYYKVKTNSTFTKDFYDLYHSLKNGDLKEYSNYHFDYSEEWAVEKYKNDFYTSYGNGKGFGINNISMDYGFDVLQLKILQGITKHRIDCDNEETKVIAILRPSEWLEYNNSLTFLIHFAEK